MGWRLVVMWMLVASACETPRNDVTACSEICDACSVGPCVAGGGGHCESATRRSCILDAGDDCLRVQVCISDMRDQ